ncbi:unnamed protein product [Sympodiomycopsis kandeliae]
MARLNNKRKRHTQDQNGGHSEDQDFGNQSLPVAILPQDFDGNPLDGSQYLAMVRAEAATHPSIYQAASNPYAAVASTSKIPQENAVSRAQELGIPAVELREQFIVRYKAMRQSLTFVPEDPAPQSYNNRGRVPKIKYTPTANRNWFRFVFRREKPVDEDGNVLPAQGATIAAEEDEDADEADSDQGDESAFEAGSGSDTQKYRQPTCGLLQRLTIGHYFSLLDAIPYWVAIPPQLIDDPHNVHNTQEDTPALHPLLSQWCFAVLAALDSRLTSDEISSLRVLARSCIAAIALRRTAFPLTSDNRHATAQAEGGAWMIVAIIAGIWGQSDLWTDAEEDLQRVAAAAAVDSS